MIRSVRGQALACPDAETLLRIVNFIFDKTSTDPISIDASAFWAEACPRMPWPETLLLRYKKGSTLASVASQLRVSAEQVRSRCLRCKVAINHSEHRNRMFRLIAGCANLEALPTPQHCVIDGNQLRYIRKQEAEYLVELGMLRPRSLSQPWKFVIRTDLKYEDDEFVLKRMKMLATT